MSLEMRNKALQDDRDDKGVRVAVEGCEEARLGHHYNPIAKKADAAEASDCMWEGKGVRVAVEGCGHGTLNAIYRGVEEAAAMRGWSGVDLVLICGDFQAVRNGRDVEVMSVPSKYRVLGDFHEYYSGARKAPYLTLFIGGNHEAAAHMWELYYGGWVAPSIYYMGAANVLRLGPLRIAGLSGIWKGYDYRKPHCERLPFSNDDIKSFYHVRELDVRKLLQIRGQVDVGVSHDWPRGIEKHGDLASLYRLRPLWKQDIMDGTLGSPAAEYVMDRLRPAHWFSSHMHWKFVAIKSYPPPPQQASSGAGVTEQARAVDVPAAAPSTTDTTAGRNADEIDLDADDDEEGTPCGEAGDRPASAGQGGEYTTTGNTAAVPHHIRAQLPVSFAQPKAQAQAQAQAQTQPSGESRRTPGQPVPPTITNTEIRFLALNKCENGRDFLQLCELDPFNPLDPPDHKQDVAQAQESPTGSLALDRYVLQYDAEWLAIARYFHRQLVVGDRTAAVPPDAGEEAYLPLIAQERAWVEENIVRRGRLEVPRNFALTATPLVPGVAEDSLWDLHSGVQPLEHTNPQTAAFCDLLGVENLWDSSEDERGRRRLAGPPPSNFTDDDRKSRGNRGGRGGARWSKGGGDHARAGSGYC